MFLSTSCGLLKSTAEPQSYSFDGVKLIRPDISEMDDTRAMRQPSYSISNASRLLLRFESFLSKIDTLSLADGRRVKVYISVDSSSDVVQAQTDLTLCPVLVNWMMLATWYRAHPWGSSGVWRTAGGDYNPSECISATSHTDRTIEFDVTNWVVNYVIGRHQDYGLLLFSNTSSIGILGDLDGAKSPRIEWLKNSF